MAESTKKTTIHLHPYVHKAPQHKARETSRSMSDIVNDAVHEMRSEDAADLAAFEERANESVMTYEALVKDLKANGRM